MGIRELQTIDIIGLVVVRLHVTSWVGVGAPVDGGRTVHSNYSYLLLL